MVVSTPQSRKGTLSCWLLSYFVSGTYLYWRGWRDGDRASISFLIRISHLFVSKRAKKEEEKFAAPFSSPLIVSRILSHIFEMYSFIFTILSIFFYTDVHSYFLYIDRIAEFIAVISLRSVRGNKFLQNLWTYPGVFRSGMKNINFVLHDGSCMYTCVQFFVNF